MAFDALSKLASAGNAVDLLTVEQQAVVAQLSEEEVAVLTSVQARLNAVGGGEVEGQDVVIFRIG
ncbi:aroma-sacti cluster domain-containing protein, partial [Streptacidiphilus rugosus]|uniref:aroma-sacti cluster domain-containing protein n=1 Tax=Streptacidiphilus rugosus TaxID=405783 RepID=UPI000563EA1D